MNGTEQRVEPNYICIITNNDHWNMKVHHAAMTLGLAVKRYSSVNSLLVETTDHSKCVCLFLDYDERVQDWNHVETRLIERDIKVPSVVVVDEQNMVQTTDAVKELAQLVALRTMERDEIVEMIHQAEKMQKVIDRRIAIEHYHKLIEGLTEREKDIVDLAVEGTPNKKIATTLKVSIKTIERDRQSAYKKLNVASTAEMTRAVILADLHDVVIDTPTPMFGIK